MVYYLKKIPLVIHPPEHLLVHHLIPCPGRDDEDLAPVPAPRALDNNLITGNGFPAIAHDKFLVPCLRGIHPHHDPVGIDLSRPALVLEVDFRCRAVFGKYQVDLPFRRQ